MSITEKLAQLRAYAITAKTCIYNEDAMTALELSGATACKVNECVEAINLLIDVIEEIQGATGLDYDATSENLFI